MQTLSIKCRVCKKKTKHADLDAANEMKLGDGVALVQCAECGVMGIEQLDDKQIEQVRNGS